MAVMIVTSYECQRDLSLEPGAVGRHTIFNALAESGARTDSTGTWKQISSDETSFWPAQLLYHVYKHSGRLGSRRLQWWLGQAE